MLTKEENSLIKVQTLNYFANSLASIFLQIYIFKLTGFPGVLMFNVSAFTFLLIFYTLSGFLLRKRTTNILIRSGFLITTLSYLILVILQQNAVQYIMLIGAALGSGLGLYWSGFNLAQYVLTRTASRNQYFAKGQSFYYITAGVGPLLGGFIVSFMNSFSHNPYLGYHTLFFIVVMINFSLFLLAGNLPSYTGIKFSFRQLFKTRSRKWNMVLVQNSAQGLWDVAFNTLVSILFFLILKSELQVGFVQTLILLFTAGMSFVAGRILSRYKHLYVLGALGTTVSIIVFASWQNLFSIIVLGFLYGATFPFLNIPLASVVLNAIGENKQPWQEKYHMFLERDGVLGLARVISYFFLYLLFLKFDQTAVAKNWLIGISIFPLLLGFLLYKMNENDFRKH